MCQRLGSANGSLAVARKFTAKTFTAETLVCHASKISPESDPLARVREVFLSVGGDVLLPEVMFEFRLLGIGTDAAVRAFSEHDPIALQRAMLEVGFPKQEVDYGMDQLIESMR